MSCFGEITLRPVKEKRKEKIEERAIWVVCKKKWGMGVLLAIWGVLIAGPYHYTRTSQYRKFSGFVYKV